MGEILGILLTFLIIYGIARAIIGPDPLPPKNIKWTKKYAKD